MGSTQAKLTTVKQQPTSAQLSTQPQSLRQLSQRQALITVLLDAARDWAALPRMPKTTEDGTNYHPDFLMALGGWEKALAGVPDNQLSNAWDAARDSWDWANKRAMPLWHLQNAAKAFRLAGLPSAQSETEIILAMWERAYAEVAAMPKTEFDQLAVDILNRAASNCASFWCWDDETKREHVEAALAQQIFNRNQQSKGGNNAN